MNLPLPLSLAEAWDKLLAVATPLGAEDRPTPAALSHYLAAPLTAKRTQPAADLSAMDGYAVALDDVLGPWRLVGESAAGHPFTGTLGEGSAVRISTGAMVPEGAGAILLQENAERSGDVVSLNGQGVPNARHIRRTGFDFTTGKELLRAGTLIGAPQIALAVAAGNSTLSVIRKPHIAIIDSGDELASSPDRCEAHQIPASNGAMLEAMASPYCQSITRIGPIADRLDALVAAFERAADADIIVTSGGASVGDHDLMRPALAAYGADLNFWRVAIKPGKPLMLGKKADQIILGLPGNPVSSYVTAFLFLLPLLRAISGSPAPLPNPRPATLKHPLAGGSARHEFVRAVAHHDAVWVLDEQDSSALAALGQSNALIDRPPHAKPLEVGQTVTIYDLF